MKPQHTVFIDGISINYVAELSEDVEQSRTVRKQLFDSYMTALEDFAFAVTMGERIAVSQKIASLGKEKPSDILLRPYKEIIEYVETKNDTPPEALLKISTNRSQISDYISSLTDMPRAGKDEWRPWIVREAVFHLGNHDSLRYTSSEKYVFDKKPELMTDVELEASVPETFVNEMIQEIKKADRQGIACDRALDTFVRQNTITHITIFCWYSNFHRDESSDRCIVDLPFATRRTLLAYECDRARRQQSRIMDARSLTLPYVLDRAMDGVNNRAEFAARLENLRGDSTMQKLAGRLSEVFYLIWNDDSKAPKLLSEIMELTSNSQCPMQKMNAAVKVEHKAVPLSVTLSEVLDPDRYFNNRKYWLKKLILDRPKEKVREQNAERMKRIFPELR